MKEGWNRQTLEQVCDLIKRGIAPKYTQDESQLLVVNQKCVRDHKINFYLARRHDQTLKSVNPERLLKTGDVLVNSTGTGTLGRVAQLKKQEQESVTVDTHVTIVRPDLSKFYLPFFGYAMIYIENEIKLAGEGTSGQTELSRIKLSENFFVSYPKDIELQKQIVETLDKTFEKIDKAIANIERNIENAEELFESKLNKIFSQISNKSENKKLKEVIKTGAGGTPLKSKKEYYLNGNIPWIRSGEVNNKNIIDSEIKITNSGLKNSSAKLFPPKTVVIAMYGATAGQVGILNFECSSNQAVCGLYPNNNFLPDFLYYKFLDYKEILKSQAVGGAQPNISQQKIKEVLIPILSVSEQKKIVEKLDLINNDVQLLLLNFKKRLKSLEELKKSILEKAFKGELTSAA